MLKKPFSPLFFKESDVLNKKISLTNSTKNKLKITIYLKILTYITFLKKYVIKMTIFLNFNI